MHAGSCPLEGERRRRAPFGGAAFTLVEVTLALGILSFAVISMAGLLSVGISGLRENRQRSIESQILDWAQSVAREAYEAGNLSRLADEGPYSFDSSGLFLAEKDSPACIYKATLTPVEKTLPGSRQSLWSIEVEMRSPARDNQLLGKRALWFSK